MSFRTSLACGGLLVALVIVSTAACGDDSSASADPQKNGDPSTNPDAKAPSDSGLPSNVPSTGTIDIALVADKGAADNAVVSLGVPFPQGVLTDEKLLALKNAAGSSVDFAASVLAKWPADGSIRSILVAFKATLASGAKETWKLDYGGAQGKTVTGLAANPDGPVAALLSADWYAGSRVSGVILPVAQNKRFAKYDTGLASAFAEIDYANEGVNCGSTTAHRTYYDGPHAQYQRFLRSGDTAHYRSARAEAVWFRANEVTFYADRKLAVQVCQSDGWTPDEAIDWSVLRRMTSQGNLDDYLLTGDPAAREVVLAFGEAYRQNLPALTSGSNPQIEATERNLAWTLMGLDSYYALDARDEVKSAMVALVDRAVAWQNRGTTGALEHDINRPDPEECDDGPNGASPFMTSLLVDGVMDYWLLTGDTAKAEPLVRKLAAWYETKAITSDGLAFRYLWNCLDNDYDDSSTADLNLLIGHVFGAAYVLTKDVHWLDFGDTIAESGVENLFAERPKQWNQAARSFGRYLGYRSLGKTP